MFQSWINPFRTLIGFQSNSRDLLTELEIVFLIKDQTYTTLVDVKQGVKSKFIKSEHRLDQLALE